MPSRADHSGSAVDQGTPPRSRRSLLLFTLPGQLCALPVEKVQELLPLPLLDRPPGLPSFLEGFLDLGGQGVPVLRLDILLNLPRLAPGLYTPLILLRPDLEGAGPLALLVESARDLVSVPAEAIRPVAPGHSLNDVLEGEWTLNGQPVHLLRPAALLLAAERRRLAELLAAQEERLRQLREVSP